MATQNLAWLREAVGATRLFAGSQASLSASQTVQKHRDPWRVDDDDDDEDGSHYMPMAVRGGELFAVVDNQIRWASLTRMKEHWEEHTRTRSYGESAAGDDFYPAYKTLRVKLHERIRQLVVSPNEELMAVVTEHNVIVVVLPDPSGLFSASASAAADGGDGQKEQQAVRVKTHTIGPTTHVVSQPPIIKALWHPLGLDGNCLVTVTTSAVVRLWELDRRTLSSFSEPSVALDLKKLRHARSQSQDVGAGDMTSNRTFSTDDVEMEVTACCFGSAAGAAQAFEWSATTLWLSMAEGDVYALCPLLPTKFEPDDDGTITTLCELKEAEKRTLEADKALFGREKARLQAQCAWLAELREQYDNFESYDETDDAPPGGGGGGGRRIYSCPRSQGMAPRLQGPFVIVPNDVQDELTPCDIHVVGATAAAAIINTLDAGHDTPDRSELGTSFSTVCILSTDGRVYVCLDVDGVEPQWLPRKKDLLALGNDQQVGGDDDDTTPELLLLEALDTLRPEDAEYGRLPIFTPSTDADEYKFYVTNSRGIYEFSLEPWLQDLEAELQSSGADGLKFRTQVLSKGPGTERKRILRAAAADQGSSASGGSIAAPLLIGTEDLGRILLTVQAGQVYGVAFLDPDADEEPAALTWKPGTDLGGGASGRGGQPTEIRFDRDVYVPSAAFSASSNMAAFTQRQVDARHQRILRDEIRLSPAALSVMTDAHRVLSRETTALNDAAAELFRRCERLHDEFRHQIRQARDLAARVREFNDVSVAGEDGGSGGQGRGQGQSTRKEVVQSRIQDAKARNETLVARYDELKRRLARAGGRPISSKERAWMSEVNKVQAAAGQPGDDNEEDAAGSRKMLLRRYEEVQNIARELLEQAKEHEGPDDTAVTGIASPVDGHSKVPPDIRRHKMARMQEMLERETALVDSATEKLVRLGLMGQG